MVQKDTKLLLESWRIQGVGKKRPIDQDHQSLEERRVSEVHELVELMKLEVTRDIDDLETTKRCYLKYLG